MAESSAQQVLGGEKRWASSWQAHGGPLSSLQLLRSHDNERSAPHTSEHSEVLLIPQPIKAYKKSAEEIEQDVRCFEEAGNPSSGRQNASCSLSTAAQQKNKSKFTYTMISQKALLAQHAQEQQALHRSSVRLRHSFGYSNTSAIGRVSGVAANNERSSVLRRQPTFTTRLSSDSEEENCLANETATMAAISCNYRGPFRGLRLIL